MINDTDFSCISSAEEKILRDRAEKAEKKIGLARHEFVRRAIEHADSGARFAARSGSDIETVARIAVNLEMSIISRNGKANTTGAAAKVDRIFKARLTAGHEMPDNASRIMSPNVRGKARPYGFRISAPNSRRGGVHASARRKADALHNTHDHRVRIAKLVTRLDVLTVRLTTPNLPNRFVVKAEKEIANLQKLLAALGM